MIAIIKGCLLYTSFLGDNEEFLRKNPFVECVFRGEGEEVFPQWLTCWNHPEQWHTVPGVSHFADEHIQFGGAGITVVDLS